MGGQLQWTRRQTAKVRNIVHQVQIKIGIFVVRTILCMDALELDESHSVKEQAHGKLLERELVKCLSGFSSLKGRTVATGAWGCGAFGGDKDVKFGKMICLSLPSLTISFQ